MYVRRWVPMQKAPSRTFAKSASNQKKKGAQADSVLLFKEGWTQKQKQQEEEKITAATWNIEDSLPGTKPSTQYDLVFSNTSLFFFFFFWRLIECLAFSTFLTDSGGKIALLAVLLSPVYFFLQFFFLLSSIFILFPVFTRSHFCLLPRRFLIFVLRVIFPLRPSLLSVCGFYVRVYEVDHK